MKTRLLIVAVILAAISAKAQNIAVVNPSNETDIYQTLDEAINKATEGSVIYLPGGSIRLSDETKINKRLTLLGVSHRGDTDNADGATVVAGNINFTGNSSGSSVIGIYLTGNVNIGDGEISVNNIVVRKCNINSIQINNDSCSGTLVNQCYLRNPSRFAGLNGKMSNCIASVVTNVNGCDIQNNIFLKSAELERYRVYALYANNSYITGNIIIATNHFNTYYVSAVPNKYVGGTNNTGSHNIIKGGDFGDNCIDIGDTEWADIFEKYNGGQIGINSNYHLTGEYKQYEGKIGIYGGTGFSDDALAPIPRIVSKKVDEQTDGTGRLHIEVTVKSN